eukprot:NODE_835_length_3613_cov_0.278600.p3 type:complete len:189 gc:universal NODE_835_length_3613_cov_0.278600:1848-2414(+)
MKHSKNPFQIGFLALGLTILLYLMIPTPVSTLNSKIYKKTRLSGFFPPKNIYMSVKDKGHTDRFVTQAMKSIPEGYKVVQFDDDDCYKLLSEYPVYTEMVKSFIFGVMRSDFCRYLFIYHHGGIYIDSDVVIRKDPMLWTQLSANLLIENEPIKMVVGLETKYKGYPEPQFCDPYQTVQWAFAAHPKQ